MSDLLSRLQAAVGREFVFKGTYPIGHAPLRQYALSLEDFNPLYSDPVFAKAHGLRDVMAPPTFICDSWQYFGGDIDERGELLGRHELRDLVGLRAGNDYEFFQPVHPDDIITAKWKVLEAVVKEGRSGKTIFQNFEVSYYNQKNELLAKSIELMFHRA
jgi:acyl dehydratase